MVLTQALLLLLASAQTAPYSDIALPDGSTATYSVVCQNANAFGPWAFSASGPVASPAGSYQDALTVGDRGWNDTSLRMTEKGIQTTRYNDPSWDISAPWRQSGVWQPAYVRVSLAPPIGASNGEVWPKAALTIRANRSRLVVEVRNAPCESLRVVGSDNDVTVYAFSGEQSRLMLNRPAVHVEGARNKVHGYADHPLCALYVKGPDNEVSRFTAVGGEVGDDTGLVYIDKVSARTRLVGVSVVARPRKYPVSHGQQGFYLDEQVSGCVLTDCSAYGFQRGVYGHGASYTTVKGLRAALCQTAVLFAPYFKTPNVQPAGNVVQP